MADTETNVISVHIPKAKANLDVDISKLPDDVYNEVLQKGLQSVLGRGMSDIKVTGLEGDELETARGVAFEKAQANLEQCYAGEIRFMATKKTKVRGKERTEAMRRAKIIVKDQMKAEGLKVSHYSAKEITLAAEQVLEDNPDILVEAREFLAAQEKKNAGKVKISLKTSMKADPKRVKAAEEKKAKAKATSAAKQREKGEVRARA